MLCALIVGIKILLFRDRKYSKKLNSYIQCKVRTIIGYATLYYTDVAVLT